MTVSGLRLALAGCLSSSQCQELSSGRDVSLFHLLHKDGIGNEKKKSYGEIVIVDVS